MFPGVQLGWVPSFLLQVFGSLDVETSLPSFLKVSECELQMETDSDLLILVYARNQGERVTHGRKGNKEESTPNSEFAFWKRNWGRARGGFQLQCRPTALQFPACNTVWFCVPQFNSSRMQTVICKVGRTGISPSPFIQLEPSSSLYTIIQTEQFCSRSWCIKVF